MTAHENDAMRARVALPILAIPPITAATCTLP